MPKQRMIACVVILMLVASGCSSRPGAHQPECLPPPPPPAWMIQSQPSSMPLLDKIITPSEPR